jgi:lysophospholipase L1-like esterase
MAQRASIGLSVAAAFSVLFGGTPAALQQGAPGKQWTTAWSTSQQALANERLSNATVRMIARVGVGGESLRIRLDNFYGTAPVHIGRAQVGWRRRGAAIFPGSSRQLMFMGSPDVTIPAGGTVTSDPVTLSTVAQQDVAVSLYVPDKDVQASQDGNTGMTSYVTASGAGDVAAQEGAEPFGTQTGAGLWLKAIDVLSANANGAIVAFGDSITDGACTTRDANERWPEVLAMRLDAADRRIAVLNEGIGGNTLLAKHPEPIPPSGRPGLERLDRDVLAHHNVTHVILFLGTNDLRRSSTAEMVRDGMLETIKRIKASGARVIGATVIPRHNNQQFPWDDAKTKRRNELNRWIRTQAPFDGIVDFDKAVRQQANADLLNPAFDCDGIHPTPRGSYEMGKSIDLGLFARTGGTSRR